MKRITIIVISLMIFLLCFTGIGFSQKQMLVLGTAGAGGTFNYVGSALANYLSGQLDDMDIRAITTGGSNVNIRLLNEGEADFAIANGLSLYLAYEGMGAWEGNPQKNLRAVTRTHSAAIHYVVAKDSGIKKFEDLIGVIGNTDVVGGTTRLIHADVCKYAGIDVGKTPQMNVSYVQAVDLFRDGHIKWFMASGSVPEANVTEIAFTREIDILDIGGELRDKMVKEVPYYFARTIPAGTYKGVDRDIETIDTVAAIFCDASMSEDTVYKIVKTIYEGISDVRELHVGLSDLSLDNATGGLGIPLHPGAEKYFREAGIIK